MWCEGPKPEETDAFVVLDRKVCLPPGGESSLYATCRAWVRNGALPIRKGPTPEQVAATKPSPASKLSAPPPATEEETDQTWPAECLTSFYSSNESKDTGKPKNFSAFYKTAWVAVHKRHVKKCKLRQARYASRLEELLAMAHAQEGAAADGAARK